MIDFRKFLQKISLKDEVLVIGIYDDGENKTYSFLRVIEKKGKLSIVDEILDLDSITDKVVLLNNFPVVLTFLGKPILYSKDTSNFLLNNNPNNYYVSRYIGSEDNTLTSIVRKDYLESIIDDIYNKGFKIVDLNIGPFVVNNMYGIAFKDQDISIKNIVLRFNEGKILSYMIGENEANSLISKNRGDNSMYLTYLLSSAINYKYPNDNYIHTYNDEKFKNESKNFKFKKEIKLISISLVTLFFTLLIINFITLNYFTKRNELNKVAVSKFNKQISIQNSLTEELVRKKHLLEESGLLKKQYNSFYISELGFSAPNSITLDMIEVSPVVSEVRKDEKIVFNTYTINISGKSYETTDFDSWISSLRNLGWVHKLNIEKYAKMKTGETNFILIILLK